MATLLRPGKLAWLQSHSPLYTFPPGTPHPATCADGALEQDYSLIQKSQGQGGLDLPARGRKVGVSW